MNHVLGKRIGSLMVEKELPSDKWRRKQWLCKCDCGKEIVINSAQLRRGKPDHCGCRKLDRFPDLTGQRFGKLEVLGRSDKRGTRGQRTVPLWECQCACGNICYKATDTLKNEDESMCAKCADILHTAKARQSAGYVDGTQISKIKKMRLGKANTSGVRGVTYDKSSGKWCAQIGFKNQKIKLGYYANKEDAVKARQRAEEELYEKFLEEYKNL